MIESPTQQKLTRNDKNSKRFRSSYCAKVGAAAKKKGRRGRGKRREGEKVTFPKNPVGTVDETRLFGSFHWKISGSNGKGNPVFSDGMFQMEIRVLFL